jgi:hypothetical protein
MSVPEFGAEPGRCAQGTAHAPLGPLGSRRLPRRPVQSNELAGGALLLRMREHVAVPSMASWLARYGCIWVMSLPPSSNV